MVYELLFLVFVTMFLQELGKWLISQWISILFVLQFKGRFRAFQVPHPWDRNSLPGAADAECRQT